MRTRTGALSVPPLPLPVAILFGVSLLAGVSPARGAAAPADAVVLDSDMLDGLQARSIGPAAMGGRVAALDAIQGDKLTIWVGAAGGGVWKSTDAGTTFKPVFDDQTQSIGAIAIDRSRPQTVWVGTGESWTRNSVSVGDGLYKTTDGGDSWQRVGLEHSERIARIAIDPRDPNTVYVAATGHLWDAHPERGVYKTSDGGATWKRVLFVDANTGCSDVAVDPSDPRTVYAGMWQFRRSPWSFRSGGPGSGLYKSTDGGASWRRLTAGLPAGALGRIAVAVSPSNPAVVYALAESKKTALYRSEDRGATWTETNSGTLVAARPFYFALLAVAPTDEKRVYKPSVALGMSDDAGRSFTAIGGSVHSDLHALWINPKDPYELLLGTDGGVYHSRDRGNHWRFLASLPISQFYHVSYDMDLPYNVYGGLQDNGSWMGPSQRNGAIGNRHWRVLGGGDGFWAFVDPGDQDIAYVEYQGGNMLRVRRSTGETKEIRPFPRAGEPELRFNWNTPVHVSATRPGTIYVGAQYLFRSRDRGDAWERISPDLTTDDPAKLRQPESGGLTIDNSAAENHCTIYAISESPKDAEVVWVGTDDGNVQVTRNGGRTWTNVTRRLKGLPAHTWVSSITASPHQAGAAFATFDGHMTGDMRTWVYATTDYGATWRSLSTADLQGYAHVVKQDPVNERLLFLGTENGLYLTLDGGARWARLGGPLPHVAVRDLAIQPREGDLLIATHGRGIYILDDLSPLRGLTPAALASDVALLPSRPSVMTIPTGEQRFDGDAEFRGESLDEAAFIIYYLKKRHLIGDLRLEVYDPEGKLVSTIAGGRRRGINRVPWPMRLKAPKVPPAASLVPQQFSFVGPRVPEGTYTVRLTKGGQQYAGEVRLVADPRSPHSAEDRAVQQKTALRLYGAMERLTWLVDALVDAREQLTARRAKLGTSDALGRRLTNVGDQLEALRKDLVTTREGGQLSGERQLREKLGSLYGAVNGYEGRPTASQLAYADVLEGAVKDATTRYESIAGTLASVNTLLEKRHLEPVRALDQDAWRKRQEKS